MYTPVDVVNRHGSVSNYTCVRVVGPSFPTVRDVDDMAAMFLVLTRTNNNSHTSCETRQFYL
jgi:hypothetical protein